MNGRYSRQERFTPIGEDGQRRIREARVLLVGCGALGSHMAELLVRAGVGHLNIVDRDVIDETNLQRQVLFTEADVKDGLPKAIAAERHLREINSDVSVRGIVADYTPKNAETLAEGVTLTLDGTDNFETRFLINDVSVKHGIPWVYAACLGATAIAMPILPGEGACLACLLESLPPAGGDTCETAGIVMPAVMTAVSMAGSEALKILAGKRDQLVRKIQYHDCWAASHHAFNADKPRADCETCGKRIFSYLSGRIAQQAVSLCGRNTVQITPAQAPASSLAALARQLEGVVEIRLRNDFMLKLAARGKEITVFPDGRALVFGTSDPAEARAIYAQVIGA